MYTDGNAAGSASSWSESKLLPIAESVGDAKMIGAEIWGLPVAASIRFATGEKNENWTKNKMLAADNNISHVRMA
jgi:hypothetical protein